MRYYLAKLKSSACVYEKARDELNALPEGAPEFFAKYDALLKLGDDVLIDALVLAQHTDVAMPEGKSA